MQFENERFFSAFTSLLKHWRATVQHTVVVVYSERETLLPFFKCRNLLQSLLQLPQTNFYIIAQSFHRKTANQPKIPIFVIFLKKMLKTYKIFFLERKLEKSHQQKSLIIIQLLILARKFNFFFLINFDEKNKDIFIQFSQF